MASIAAESNLLHSNISLDHGAQFCACVLFLFSQTLQQLFLMSHTFHHRGRTDCSPVIIGEQSLMSVFRPVWHRLERESKNHFVFGVDEALRSRFCVRQMQSEKVKHLCRRLQLPRMDLQSYQVEGCWRCNIWSPLSPLWQRTEPDHWRW